LGFGGGCNAGIRYALEQGADYVWLINNDATVDQSALTELVRLADSQPSGGAVGSVLYEVDRPAQVQMWGGGKVNLWAGLFAPSGVACSARFCIRRLPSAFDGKRCCRSGLFDESNLFHVWKIQIWIQVAAGRLATGGCQKKSRVWHKLSGSLGKGSRQLDVYFTRSGVRFLRRYSPAPLLSVLIDGWAHGSQTCVDG